MKKNDIIIFLRSVGNFPCSDVMSEAFPDVDGALKAKSTALCPVISKALRFYQFASF